MAFITNGKVNLKYLLIGILSFLFFVGLAVPGDVLARPLDARIQADVSHARALAELISSDYGSYANLCDGNGGLNEDAPAPYGAQIDVIEKDVISQGTNVTCYANTDRWCLSAKLVSSAGRYLCVDSAGYVRQTYINPQGTNYCTGETFVCPTVEGEPPISVTIAKIINQIAPIVGGLILFGIIIFIWIGAFRSRRIKLTEEEDRALTKKELVSNRRFYLFVKLLIVLPVVSSGLNFFSFVLGNTIADIFLPILLLIISTIIGISAIIVVFLSFRLIIKARKKTDKPETACWESYAAFLLLGLLPVIILFIISSIISGPALVFIFILMMPILGFGFGISCLIHRERIDKMLGIRISIIYLFFVLLLALALISL